MARMIGRTKSWLAWLAGSVLALVFGSAGCGQDEPPVAKYGPPPVPPAGKPDKPTTGLENSKDWKVITGAWDFAKQLLQSKGSTTQQRKEASANFASAREAGARLAATGQLLPQEADLLGVEGDKLLAQIGASKPTDLMVTCYEPVPAWEESGSLERLTKRLPLLEKLVAGGKVHPTVVERTLAGVEADIAVLSDRKQLERWWDKQKVADAEKTRDAVKAQVEKLRKLLDAEKAGRK